MSPLNDNKKLLRDFESEIYRFLDFAQRIMKQMQYLRDTTAIDYLTDSEKIPYETADKIMHIILDEGYLEYNQYGAFPGTELTPKGTAFLEQLREKFGPLEHENSVHGTKELYTNREYIGSDLPPEFEDTNEHMQLILEYESQTYAFLDFAMRIMKQMQYLRDQTAIDFLIDNEQLSYEVADKLMHAILNEEYLVYSQWGAFPGTELTEKGLAFLDQLKQKYAA